MEASTRGERGATNVTRELTGGQRPPAGAANPVPPSAAVVVVVAAAVFVRAALRAGGGDKEAQEGGEAERAQVLSRVAQGGAAGAAGSRAAGTFTDESRHTSNVPEDSRDRLHDLGLY